MMIRGPWRRFVLSQAAITDGLPLYPHAQVQLPPDYDPTRYRPWITLNPNVVDRRRRISVMSYNLLSQHYVWKKVFGYLQQEYLDWPHYRFPLINKTIESLKCDIMCFQELECLVYRDHWKWHFPHAGYKSVYARKLKPGYWGDRPADHMDGVGIFVNSERFDVVDSQVVHFADYIRQHRDKFSVTNDVAQRVLSRNTVAALMKLHDKLNDKTVYVTNTHLYWSPKFNDVKAYQTKLLLSILKDFVGEPDPHIIMCGDFNASSHSLVYQLLNTGEVDLDAATEFRPFNYGSVINNEILIDSKMRNPFHLSPAYGALLQESVYSGHKLNFTSYTRALTAVLDHIWFTRDNLAVYKVLGEVEARYTLNNTVRGFPNRDFPSDHIPLVSEVSYT